MNYDIYTDVKLLKHAMEIVEEVLEKRLRKVIAIDDMQFCFMPGRGTIDALFILRRIQEENFTKQRKLYMCFVDPEKSTRWSSKESCGMGNDWRGIQEALFTAVMSLCRVERSKVIEHIFLRSLR